ncbi:MAG: dienelactone hydrolase-like enzyme [Actinomycetia bacterium]|nr:dienelactone hydrolase-like enzyme [Actinomycetes bacterium]
MTATEVGPLAGFSCSTFTHGTATREVFRSGSGPGVIIIHELPGITPAVADFARRVVDAGFTVLVPSLVGTPGKPVSLGYTMKSVTQVCISREFSTWAMNSTSPIIEWLRALARALHAEVGGPGVGAVGMCFSGGFALAMAVEEAMVAPVCSQPSLPFAIGWARTRDIGLSPTDLELVRERTVAGQCVLALRFTNDRMVPAVRFQRLRDELGDRFTAVEIDSSPGNPHGIRKIAHSVLTEEFADRPGHPTRDAFDRVVAFFTERLASG